MKRYPSQFNPDVTVELLEEEITPQQMLSSITERQEYIVELRIGVRYACSRADKEMARENAEKQLQHHLFNTVSGPLRLALSAIFAGQADEAINQVQEALNECTR